MLLLVEQDMKLLFLIKNNMGSIGRIKTDYIISKKTTDCIMCKNCPCRIFNSNKIIRYGKGNLYGDKVIILPPYKTDSITFTPIEESILKDILLKSNISLDSCYITRAIKCYSDSKGINRNSTYHCFKTIIEEIKFIKPKYIFCFGNETVDYPNWIRDLGYDKYIFWYPTFMIKFYNENNYNNIVNDFIKNYTNTIYYD